MPYLQHEPAWTPDGRWIYFLSGDGGQSHDVWRVAIDGGRAEQLSVGSLYHFELAPGPSGRLAYSSNRSGNYEIYVEDAGDGANPRRLTDDASLDGGPSWSPDGRTLIFHSLRGGRFELWQVGAMGGAATKLSVPTESARAPNWWHSAQESQP
jgi:TolB protein